MKTMTMNNCLILCRDLEIGYERGLLPPFDLDIEKGDFLGIAGPNGSGKSTLIRTILGMIPPLGGTVTFPSGNPVFGYVPQQKNITSDHPLTAYETVMMGKYGAKILVKITGQDKTDVTEKMKKMGVDHLKDRRFSSLSGGQKQRVLIARALVANPEVLILDEPAQGMDNAGERSLVETISGLNKNSEITIILISHQINTISGIANKSIQLDDSGLKEVK